MTEWRTLKLFSGTNFLQAPHSCCCPLTSIYSQVLLFAQFNRAYSRNLHVKCCLSVWPSLPPSIYISTLLQVFPRFIFLVFIYINFILLQVRLISFFTHLHGKANRGDNGGEGRSSQCGDQSSGDRCWGQAVNASDYYYYYYYFLTYSMVQSPSWEAN